MKEKGWLSMNVKKVLINLLKIQIIINNIDIIIIKTQCISMNVIHDWKNLKTLYRSNKKLVLSTICDKYGSNNDKI